MEEFKTDIPELDAMLSECRVFMKLFDTSRIF